MDAGVPWPAAIGYAATNINGGFEAVFRGGADGRSVML
jgi:hypothetical protein